VNFTVFIWAPSPFILPSPLRCVRPFPRDKVPLPFGPPFVFAPPIPFDFFVFLPGTFLNRRNVLPLFPHFMSVFTFFPPLFPPCSVCHRQPPWEIFLWSKPPKVFLNSFLSELFLSFFPLFNPFFFGNFLFRSPSPSPF